MVLMSLRDFVAPSVHLSEYELDDELILDPNDNIHLRGSSCLAWFFSFFGSSFPSCVVNKMGRRLGFDACSFNAPDLAWHTG